MTSGPGREAGRATGAEQGPAGNRPGTEGNGKLGVEVSDLEVTDDLGGPAPRRKRWLPRTVRHLAELLVVGFLVELLVVPQIGGTHKALHVLAAVNPFLPLLGVGLEVLSLLAYFALTRALIPKRSDPGLLTVARIQLSTLSLSHCLPGGNAVGYSLGYRLLTKAGVSGTDTGFALATQALGSAVVLNIIFWLALLVSLPLYGFQVVYLSVAIVGMVLMSAIAGLVVLFTKGDQRALQVVRALGRHLPFVSSDTLTRVFTQLAHRVQELSRDRRQMGTALGLAALNWLLDAASLFVFVGAFGHWVDPVGVLVAYGVAYIVAALPITPGGLGVVETALTGILVGFGAPRTIALWGVIGYRLVNFWLPIPAGGLAYLSIRVHPPAGDQAGLAARRAVWRARWRWVVELFGADTPTPVPATHLPGIGEDEGAGHGVDAVPGGSTAAPTGTRSAAGRGEPRRPPGRPARPGESQPPGAGC
jgi:uncharacterized protein (TIRG00374 family)